MRTKVITVNSTVYRVYSLDGRTWSSQPKDLQQFCERYAAECDGLRKLFALIDTATLLDIEY